RALYEGCAGVAGVVAPGRPGIRLRAARGAGPGQEQRGMGTPPDSGRELADIAEQLEHLRRQHDLDRRALEALHRISLACRGLASERAIFDVLCRELRAVFALDSSFIAVCDPQNPDVFRIAMLYDEGLVEY